MPTEFHRSCADDALSAACTEIGRTDPTRLAEMHWDWTAAQSASD